MNAVLRTDVVNTQKIGMIQRAENAGLAFEPVEALGVIGESGGQNLNRDIAVSARVARTIYFAHPARAKRCNNLIGP